MWTRARIIWSFHFCCRILSVCGSHCLLSRFRFLCIAIETDFRIPTSSLFLFLRTFISEQICWRCGCCIDWFHYFYFPPISKYTLSQPWCVQPIHALGVARCWLAMQTSPNALRFRAQRMNVAQPALAFFPLLFVLQSIVGESLFCCLDFSYSLPFELSTSTHLYLMSVLFLSGHVRHACVCVGNDARCRRNHEGMLDIDLHGRGVLCGWLCVSCFLHLFSHFFAAGILCVVCGFLFTFPPFLAYHVWCICFVVGSVFVLRLFTLSVLVSQNGGHIFSFFSVLF